MKKCFIPALRNIKETLREPLSMIFCLGFPCVMLFLMQIIFKNMAFTPSNFEIKNYAAGICVFGYTFTGLFVALSISSDKNTSFIKRINISPISKFCYFASFFVSSFPIISAQTFLFYVPALIFGFSFDVNFVLSIIYLLPSAVFYVCIGLLIGSLCASEKMTGPMSSIFISLTGIFDGVFMPIDSFGGAFANIIELLPFSHSVLIASQLHTVGASCIYPHILYLAAYIFLTVAIVAIIEGVKTLKK